MNPIVNKSKEQPVYTSLNILTTDPVVSTDQADIYSNSQNESQNSSCEIIDVVIESSVPPVDDVVESHSTDLTTINNYFDSPTTISLSTYDLNQHNSSSTDYIEYGNRDCYSRRQGSFYRYANNKLVAELVYKDDVLVYTCREFKYNIMKEYNMNHELIYEGNYEGDRKNGFYRNRSGKEYRNGHLYFDGKWEKNIVNGFGVLYSKNSEDTFEGEWDNGWLVLDNGYYYHEKDKFYKHLPGYFFSWCDFFTGMLFLLTIMVYKFECGSSIGCDPIYQYLGVLYFIKAFLDNYNNLLCILIEGHIMFLLMSLFYSFQNEYRKIALKNSILCIFLYYLTQILCPSFIYLSSVQLLLGYTYPNSISTCFKKKNINGWCMIYLEKVCCYVMFAQLYITLFNYGKRLPTDYTIVYCIFMLLDILVYWVISILHSQHGKLFNIGICIGIVWGILSCILSIVFFYMIDYHPEMIDTRYYFDKAQKGIQSVVYYTWFLSLSSFILYKCNKPNSTLPITH